MHAPSPEKSSNDNSRQEDIVKPSAHASETEKFEKLLFCLITIKQPASRQGTIAQVLVPSIDNR